MPGYKYMFVDRVKRRWICYICSLPMREPVQITTCGHKFCDSCLQEFLSEGIFKCPEDELPLDYAKIYPDPDVNQEIMSANIRCTFHHKGCQWVDQLCTLQSHLDTCKYNTVPCPNNCHAQLSRICLDDHVTYTCLRRKVVCESCGLEFTGESMEVHQGNCPFEVVWCENKCGARLQRRYLNNHMRNECHKRTQPCQHCNKEFVYETLQSHYHTCSRFPITCPNRCDPAKISREDVEIHLKEECPSASVTCSFRDAGCKYVGPRYSLDKHLEDTTKHHLSLMCQLSLRHEKQIQQLTSRLQTLNRVTDGNFIFKIPNYKSQLADAKVLPHLEIQSESFYSSQFGYRLCASAFLNGNGPGEKSHISLYVKILPGEYDNILEWPFRLPITLQLVDQCFDPEKRAHVTESFVPNPNWKHFLKPARDSEGMGFGYPKFISHETLKNHGTFVKDDTIFFKIKVDKPDYILP